MCCEVHVASILMRWFRQNLVLILCLVVAMFAANEALCWHEHNESASEIANIQQQVPDHVPGDMGDGCRCLVCHHHHHTIVVMTDADSLKAFNPVVVDYMMADMPAPDGISRSIDYPPQLIG